MVPTLGRVTSGLRIFCVRNAKPQNKIFFAKIFDPTSQFIYNVLELDILGI